MWLLVAARWLPALLWMALIFYISSQSSLPQAPSPALQIILSYLAHFTEYVILTILLLGALGVESRRDNAKLLVVFLLALLYAISDEFHQSFVPGRVASPIDLVVDTLGIASVLLLTLIRTTSRNG